MRYLVTRPRKIIANKDGLDPKRSAFWWGLFVLFIVVTPAISLAGEKLSFERLELKAGVTVLKADGVEIENSWRRIAKT